jgi:hypothetical protein
LEKIVDILGQEIKVGDVVVATNQSTIYNQVHVVTRLGSADKIQVNGSSYAKAVYLMVINEQYKIAKGEEKFDALRMQHEEYMNEERVVKKPHTPRFLVLRYADYPRNVNGKYTVDQCPVFYVIGTCATIQDTVKKINDITKDCSKGEYFERKNLKPKNMQFSYSDFSKDFSRKALVEIDMDLELWVDQRVSEDSETYKKLLTLQNR